MAWPNSFVDRTAPAGNAVRNNLSAEMNAVWTAIETLEAVIGLLPQGAAATIAARLDALESSVTNLDVSDAVSTALAGHTDDTAPHPGHFGKIISPERPGGDGTFYIGGTISATGPDNEAWIDT